MMVDRDWLQNVVLSYQVHPLLGALSLFDPNVGQKTGRVAEQVGGWTLGRLGLHKVLGSFAAPVGALLLGGVLGSLGRFFRRPGPKGRVQDAYESFQKSGQLNLHTGLMNFLAQQQAQYVNELLASARNMSNRALGAAVAQAVAPEAMRAATERYGMALRAGLEREQLIADRIYRDRQLQLEKERMAMERQSEQRARQLQMLGAVLPYVFGQSK